MDPAAELQAELPSTPDLTVLDKLQAYGSIVALGLFVRFPWGANRIEAAAPDLKPSVPRRIHPLDRLCQLGALAGLSVVALLSRFF